MFGLFNINKPPGITSRDVVNHVQRLVRGAKTGHAGTLDPLATGVLVVCVGPATRLMSYVQRMEKSYRGTFQLGARSDTDDTDGQVDPVPDAAIPTLVELDRVLPRFRGAIEQLPPAYSALKVAGRRAYALARAGRPPQLAPRRVTISQLETVSYEYPRLVLDVRCGSGTYIRALGRDVAAALGTAAVMSELERTAIGSFDVTSAVRLKDLTRDTMAGLLLPPRRAVSELPDVRLTPEEVWRVGRGLTIENRFGTEAAEVAALDERNQLAAILVPRGSSSYGPAKNFVGLR